MSSLEASRLFNVNGMVFVISGGGTGIGAMMARSLDANGASKVFVLGRRLEKLQEVAKQAPNASIIPVACDVTSQAELAKAVESITSQAPFVNVVIANHGTMGPVLDGLPKERTPSLEEMYDFLWKVPISDFTDTYLINTSAMFYTFVAFLKLLKAGNEHKDSPTIPLGVKSQFIATSSIGAFSRKPGAGFAYAGSKAAVIHIVKQLATMMVPYQIRANIIAPGIYPSVMSEFTLKNEGPVLPQSMVPLQRPGSEQDVAGMTLFLCSQAGSYINGNVLVTDGGRLSIFPATY